MPSRFASDVARAATGTARSDLSQPRERPMAFHRVDPARTTGPFIARLGLQG